MEVIPHVETIYRQKFLEVCEGEKRHRKVNTVACRIPSLHEHECSHKNVTG